MVRTKARVSLKALTDGLWGQRVRERLNMGASGRLIDHLVRTVVLLLFYCTAEGFRKVSAVGFEVDVLCLPKN